MRPTLIVALMLGCPGESATDAYRRGQEDLRREQNEQYTCRDGETYPVSSMFDVFSKRTHLCVHGYWIAIAAERRADLPVRPCGPPDCVVFQTKEPTP